ncbi:unannotated protein [freshwater metagenome]|uniref:Unannotated protein n=1 Tax=freshwater metagenome TaxID=449393 RepID=A0A6J6J605_9ZZZZ|nr:hypothetical protein [Actinomycetota bacterium]
MTKSRALTLWAALVILSYIFASQDWYTLSMSPNGESVKLASFDGMSAYGNLSPLLMLNFAAILVVSFVGSLARKFVTATIVLANLATAIWLGIRVQQQDISGLAKQVEQMTGIAAAHGVEDLSVSSLWASSGFLVALGLTTALVAVIFFTERSWPKRASKTERVATSRKAEEPKDAIGIWDSQR